ncbi:hypothetical protein ACI09I_000889 [Cronobacter dublinensis]
MSELSKERLEKIASWRETYGSAHNVVLPAEEAEVMARELLALRERAEPDQHEAHIRREVNAGGNTWIQCSKQAFEREKARGALCRVLYESPPAPVVDEWTNEQCLEFLAVAFRHAEIKGDFELDDLRLGVKMANAMTPGKEG